MEMSLCGSTDAEERAKTLGDLSPMCFSTEASFTAAAALLPVGAYCVHSAIGKNMRFLPLALTPVAFAVQQAAEGCVWYGLGHAHRMMVQWSTAIFLFFALAFWPFWVPFSLRFVERRRLARVILTIVAALSLSWFGFYVVAVLSPERDLYARVVGHSIDYGLADLHGFRRLPLVIWQLVYLACICGPLLIARTGSGAARWRLCGGIVAALLVVSDLVYWYAFASVWCFFAAVSSLLLAFTFIKLPPQVRHSLAYSPQA
jgi:hypothetical protein